MISIIIPTQGKNPSLEAGVRSCLLQDHPSFEVIIAFNGDSQLRPIAGARVISSARIGVNRARNAGARAAKGELLFFMDDDCRMIDTGFLCRLEKLFAENPQFSAIGGPYINPPQAPRVIRSYHSFTRLWINTGLGPRDGAVFHARNLLGGNLGVRRQVFDSGIFFHDAILSGGDETEFLRTIELHRLGIGFAPELTLEHHANPSWRHAAIRTWKQNRGRAVHRLGSGRIPSLSASSVEAWPHLFLHLGIGSLASLYSKVQRRGLDHLEIRG